MSRALDVVHHVADERGFVRHQIVLGQNLRDRRALIHHPDVSLLEEMPDPEPRGLLGKVRLLDRAEEKNAPPGRLAEAEEFERMRQENDGVLPFDEMRVKERVELGCGDTREKLSVERIERQPEELAEFFEQQLRSPV